MNKIYKNISKSITHLSILHDVFSNINNFSDKNDYKLYVENYNRIEDVSDQIGFAEQLYSQHGRQMILADIIEYIFFSRGIFSLMKTNKYQEKNIPLFIELILRFVNLLMLYEVATVDKKIRRILLITLKTHLKDIGRESDFSKLLHWQGNIGLTRKETPLEAPAEYFDSMLPKTAGGLWHEMLIYAFILRYNIGYIFPLLLHQKVISLNDKLSPPDIILLHKKTKKFYGVEIGDLKERQSGGFMAPTGIPVIPVDTRNCRISDRCPKCKKWIGIPNKVIKEFSDPNFRIKHNEVRNLYDSEDYTLLEKINGADPFMKYYNGKFHYHYKCVLNDNMKADIKKDIMEKHNLTAGDLQLLFKRKERVLPSNDDLRSKKINYLKTHYLWYPELSKLI